MANAFQDIDGINIDKPAETRSHKGNRNPPPKEPETDSQSGNAQETNTSRHDRSEEFFLVSTIQIQHTIFRLTPFRILMPAIMTNGRNM